MHTVLLVEDDPAVQAALMRALSDRYALVAADTATEALRMIANRPVDLVVLDLTLPDLDGAIALRMIRGVSNVPVIIATARTGERNMIQLLDAGADDYVVKPFSSEHLCARIGAQLRRTTPPAGPPVLRVDGLRIDLAERAVWLDDRRVDLSRREFDLLAYLAKNAGKVVSRHAVRQTVWQGSGNDQTIDVHMTWLRRKLGETAANPRYLHTVRGVGIMLNPSR